MGAISLTTLTAGCVGMLYFGSLTTKHYWNYKREINGSQKEAEWQKTKQFAQAFYSDMKCFAFGSIMTSVICFLNFSVIRISKGIYLNYPVPLGKGILKTTNEKIRALAALLCCCGGLLSLLFEKQTPRILSQILMETPRQAPLFLSLALREDFGFVGKGSEAFLSFSSRNDKFEYDTMTESQAIYYQFKGPAFETLLKCVIRAELELVDLIKELNALLSVKDYKTKPLKYHYPFNGEEIANDFGAYLHSLDYPLDELKVAYKGADQLKAHIDKLIGNLKNTQFKLEKFRSYFNTCLSLNFIKGLSDYNCYVLEKDYKAYFEKGEAQGSKTLTENKFLNNFRKYYPVPLLK